MSKKIAAASIVALVFSGVAIPGGIIINDFIADMTYGYVNEGLLAVKEQGAELALPMMKQYGVAVAMQMIWDEAMPYIEEIVNSTFLAYVMNLTLTGLYEEISEFGGLVTGIIDIPAIASDDFFNNESAIFDVDVIVSIFGSPLPPEDIIEISGLANYSGAPLGISANASQLLLYGNHTEDPYSPYYIPGLIYDIDTGFGVLDFRTLYYEANTTEKQDAMAAMYNCTWEQLEKIEEYMINYLKAVLIPVIIAGVDILGGLYHVDILELIEPQIVGCKSTMEVAEKMAMMQWTNCSLMEEGIDFHLVDDLIPPYTYGFELCPPYESGISLESALMLWDRNDELALTNLTNGIILWIEAQDDEEMQEELMDHFGLTDDQMKILLDWLWAPGNFSDYTLPYLVESDFGFGMPMETLTFHLLLGQWANGTIFGEEIFPPPGFPLPLSAGTKYGFEINIDDPSNMTLDSALALWDETSDYGLISETGLNNWLYLVGQNEPTSDFYIEMRDQNDLTDRQVDLLLDWLPRFQHEVMPFLAQEALGLPMDSITLGLTIEMAMIAIGGVLIGLASTGFIGNRYVKVHTRNLELAPPKIGYPNRKKVLPPSSQYKRVWNKEFGHYEYIKK